MLGRCPVAPGGSWRHRTWPGTLDQLPVAHRIVADRHLVDAQEHQAAAAQGAAGAGKTTDRI